jgi:starch phosphorylase
VLLEEYDMRIGRMLVAGCDLWLNTPVRPHEASGTSGMKVPLNGGINCSIADGWWPEADDGRNGWTIPASRHTDPTRRDRDDARSLYRLLEREIVPEFHRRTRGGLPKAWLQRALRSAATVAPRFTSDRMVGEYLDAAYRGV